MSRTLTVPDVPYGKDVVVLETDCMDEGSIKYHRRGPPADSLVMRIVKQRANMGLGLLIDSTLQLACPCKTYR